MTRLRQAAPQPLDVPRFSPAGLASSGTEHGEQAAFFCYATRAYWMGVAVADDMAAYGASSVAAELRERIAAKNPALPQLRWLHAIPNGGERGAAAAGNMKMEGVKRGVADIFLPLSMQGYHGLYIELKRKNGVFSDLSDEQQAFGLDVTTAGYYWTWCKGWLAAREVLLGYCKLGHWSEQP